jgi:mannose-6-phosphate isomerase-like protein (cupin superfamily)
MDKVNLAEKLSLFSEHWSPKIIGSVDDYEVKVVKLEGDFVWHKHDDADELFLVINGELDMDFRDRRVSLGSGELIVVPKGTEHKPHAEKECEVLLLERKGLVNTGDAEPSDQTNAAERI